MSSISFLLFQPGRWRQDERAAIRARSSAFAHHSARRRQNGILPYHLCRGAGKFWILRGAPKNIWSTLTLQIYLSK